MGAKAIFLDKDGTLIEDVPYNIALDKIKLSEDCVVGLKRLHRKGYQLIVVSNQSGIARGYFKLAELNKALAKMKDLFATLGVFFTAFYFCPHHPQGTESRFSITCNCRKPANGMFMQAAIDHNLDLKNSWMIGDILNDIEAGKRAGCRSVLIDNGNETEWISGNFRQPDYTCTTINEAADFILKNEYEDRV